MDKFIFQSHETLPEKVGEQIKKMIARGGSRRGDPLPSYREMCERFNVSLLTVKRAMDGLAKEGIVHVQPGKGVFVDREPAVQKRKLEQIGVVFFCSRKLMFTSQYLVEIFQGVLQEAEAIAADTRLFSIKNQGPMPPEEVEASGVDGVILVGVANERYLRSFALQHLPVVAVDVDAPDVPMEFVGADNVAAMQQVMEHLVALGHRRIHYVDGWSTDTTVSKSSGQPDPIIETSDVVERREAYVKTMRALGFGDGVVHGIQKSGGAGVSSAGAADVIARMNPALRPTAVLTYDTSIARDVIARLDELGLSVPRDISVAAVAGAGDALIGSATLCYNRVRFVEMGARAVQTLAARCQKSRATKTVVIKIGSDFVAGTTAAAAEPQGSER